MPHNEKARPTSSLPLGSARATEAVGSSAHAWRGEIDMTTQAIRAIVFFIMAGVGLLGIIIVTTSSARAQVSISNDGVTFPDDSVQTTAAPSQAGYAIGDTGPAGGFVFYVTTDGLHGLEAAPVDQSTDAPWGCFGADVVPATANTSLGTGASNTNDIIRGCTVAGIAAALAAEYTSPSGYYDWYLPSIDELDLMRQNLYLVALGGLTDDTYWSSSEVDTGFAWALWFQADAQNNNVKNITNSVRAVRAF